MTHASEYTSQMVAEIETLERTICAAFTDGLDRHPVDVREMAADLLDAGGLEPDQLDALYPFDVWVEAYALDVTVRGHRAAHDDEWTVDTVEVLRTAGGPDARISTAERGWITVSVYWDSAETARVYAPRLWECLDSLPVANW